MAWIYFASISDVEMITRCRSWDIRSGLIGCSEVVRSKQLKLYICFYTFIW